MERASEPMSACFSKLGTKKRNLQFLAHSVCDIMGLKYIKNISDWAAWFSNTWKGDVEIACRVVYFFNSNSVWDREEIQRSDRYQSSDWNINSISMSCNWFLWRLNTKKTSRTRPYMRVWTSLRRVFKKSWGVVCGVNIIDLMKKHGENGD